MAEAKRYAMDEHSTVVIAIEKLADSLDRINDRHDRFEERIGLKIDKIQDDVNKFGVLFEKLLHVEKSHEESSKRIHKRIDEVVQKIEKIENLQNNVGCATLREFKKDIEPKLLTISKLDDSVKTLEDKPSVIIGKFGMSVIAVLGAGLGTWILLKLGVSTK